MTGQCQKVLSFLRFVLQTRKNQVLFGKGLLKGKKLRSPFYIQLLFCPSPGIQILPVTRHSNFSHYKAFTFFPLQGIQIFPVIRHSNFSRNKAFDHENKKKKKAVYFIDGHRKYVYNV